MATFPRTILPRTVTLPKWPTGLLSVGLSGKAQTRAITQVGREWTETYGVLDPRTASVRALLATVNAAFSQRTIYDVDHRSLRDIMGTGPGGLTPNVNGASQTGTSLITDGWTAASTMKIGDVIKIAGLNPVYDVMADVTANGSGQATLTLNPPIYTAPADNAAILTNYAAGTVLFRAFIAATNAAEADTDQLVAGLTVTWREAI